MKTIKLICLAIISVIAVYGLFAAALYIYGKSPFYNAELRKIWKELNEMNGVTVQNIWGHHDLSLEEISAAITIEGKGEMVLNNLSKDVYDYPQRVIISQIGNYSFTWYAYNGGVGQSIDIGTGTCGAALNQLIGVHINTVSDVINHYDRIYQVIDSLKRHQELNHFVTDNYEFYLLIKDEKAKQQDPIYCLVDVEDDFEFARTLTWERNDNSWEKSPEPQ